MLQEKYDQFALHPEYITSDVDVESMREELCELIASDDKNEKENPVGDDDMVEVLVVSDEFALKPEGEDSVEYEIMEVVQSEYNGATDPDDFAARNELIDCDQVLIETSTVAEDEPVAEINQTKGDKLPTAGFRRSQRCSARREILDGVKAQTPSARRPRKSSLLAEVAKSLEKRKNTVRTGVKEESVEVQQIDSIDEEYCEEQANEGESDDEFPARDSDNDDWPAQQTMSEFPKEILRDGLLQIKGKQLMSMICK